MNDFLFTFSSKQFNDHLSSNIERHNPTTEKPKANNESVYPPYRTKKKKRYDKILEHNGIRKYLTEVDNEFIGLQNVESQTLVKLSMHPSAFPSNGLNLFKEKIRKTYMKDINASQCFEKNMKPETIFRNHHMTPKQTRTTFAKEKQEENDRRRLNSLKDVPLISYPSNEMKLPKAFRSKTLIQKIQKTEKEKEEAEDKKKTSLKKFRVPSSAKNEIERRRGSHHYEPRLNAQDIAIPRSPGFHY